MVWLLSFITGALIGITVMMISNVLFFPRLEQRTRPAQQPFVSVLIPARDEAAVIAKTISKHLKQSYTNFELLILDDSSSDATAEIASQAAQADNRLQVISGKPLPDGWMGKSWACHQLAQMAAGQILVFTDADVQWQPDALSALIAQMQTTDVDLYTIWPTQQTDSWSERLVVPLMAFAILGYLPVIMTHYSPVPVFAAANGQCMAWKRASYFKTGGHQAVAGNVLDDVTLARIAKQNRFSLRMADGANLIQTRMYRDWCSVRDGFAKNILAGYGNSVFALAAASLFHWLLFILPYILLFMPQYRIWAVALILLGVGTRALSAAFTKQRVADAILMPFSVLLITRIATRAIHWHYSGGPHWKGRNLNHNQEEISQWNENPSSSSAQALVD